MRALNLQNLSQCSAVGDNAIMNNKKLRLGVEVDRVAIALRRRTISSPSHMSNQDLSGASLLNIKTRYSNLLVQTSNLANFFKVFNCSRFITVNGKTCRVIFIIFLMHKAISQGPLNGTKKISCQITDKGNK